MKSSRDFYVTPRKSNENSSHDQKLRKGDPVRGHVCVPKFGMCEVWGPVPKSIYQASYLLPSDFPNNFS